MIKNEKDLEQKKSIRIEKLLYGKASFSQQPTKKGIMKPSIVKILEKDLWQIYDRDYEKNTWKSIFQSMQQSSALTIWLDNNLNSHIVKTIKNIYFSDLKVLSLYGNNINNIQALNQVKCQKLQILNLGGNVICQIKSIIKLSTPQLNSICLNCNPLLNINPLVKAKLNSSTIVYLFLQNVPVLVPINQDISIVNKLPSQSMSILSIRSKTRIVQLKIMQILRQRFTFIQINNYKPWQWD